VRITVNDREREVADGASLGGLLAELGLDHRAVVVERNGEVVPRDAAPDTPLAEGDRLIVVKAVAGGAEPPGGGEHARRPRSAGGAEPPGGGEHARRPRSAGGAEPPGGGEHARRERLEAARLYVVTDARRDRGDLGTFLGRVCDGGADLVQLREKDATDDELRRHAVVFRRVCDATGTLFVLNDRPDLAVEVGADGAHVGQDDLDPAKARELVGDDLLLGLSTHGPGQLDAALEAPVDHVGVGPVHATPTKPGRPGIGLEAVRYAAANATVPWFVTGGMNERTVPEVVATGARAVVVVRAVTEADDPGVAVRRLRDLLPG
jgi:thiamine-phosphate pyrophosphorylase